MDKMTENYILTHALRIKDPNISEAQKANCKWRIAEVCNFQTKYDDFDRENCTLTEAQETEVMAIIAETLKDA